MHQTTCYATVHHLLHRLGVTANYTGFSQTVCAVLLILGSPEYLQLVTKQLYPAVAKQHRTSSQAVERNIRSVVNLAWTHNADLLQQLSGYPLPVRPSNSVFLSILVNYVLDE